MRFRLIPSDRSFYDLFDRSVDNLAASVKALKGFLGDDANAEATRRKIADLEHVGDELLTDTLKRLDASFVTPIEREDISLLISRIDDVVDSVHNVAELIAITGVPAIGEFARLVDLLSEAADETVNVVKALRNFKGIREYAERISTLESVGDNLYRQALAHLFDGTYDALDIIKSKDVIEAIEQALDEIEDVGDTCESIFVKARVTDLAVVAVIAFALAFDFTNGFHDAANSIATVVSTRVLAPRVAVVWAAFFNFMAFFVFHTHIANTIAKGVVQQDYLSVGVIFAGLSGAVAWNLCTFWLGLPTSSSHALVGGIAGAAVARHGFGVLVSAGINKILIFIVLSPLIGMALGWLGMVLLLWIASRFHNVRIINLIFRRTQLISSAAFSLGHGANDSQKTMGVILAVLIASHHLPTHASVPLWVVFACYATIAAGTMMGGLRIIRTMGSRITRLQPIGGTVAETSAAITLFYTSAAGIPVSTTHAIAGSIAGVGSAKRASAVNWKVAGNVVWAWILTLPGAFIPAAACSLLIAAVS